MSTQYFGFANPDNRIYKSYPAVVYIPTEANGLYFEQREITGDVWLVTNAAFDEIGLQWYQPNPPCDQTQPASAFVLHANGTVTKFTAPPTNSATNAVNWGASVFTLDSGGNLTISGLMVSANGGQIVGNLDNVPADGSNYGQVAYNVFSVQTNFAFCQIKNPYLTNPWQLSAPQVTNYTKTGFQVAVGGGPPGSTVSINFMAFGV